MAAGNVPSKNLCKGRYLSLSSNTPEKQKAPQSAQSNCFHFFGDSLIHKFRVVKSILFPNSQTVDLHLFLKMEHTRGAWVAQSFT